MPTYAACPKPGRLDRSTACDLAVCLNFFHCHYLMKMPAVCWMWIHAIYKITYSNKNINLSLFNRVSTMIKNFPTNSPKQILDTAQLCKKNFFNIFEIFRLLTIELLQLQSRSKFGINFYFQWKLLPFITKQLLSKFSLVLSRIPMELFRKPSWSPNDNFWYFVKICK